MIVRGGENMSPGEIEGLLLIHPAIVVRDGHDQPDADALKALIRIRLRSSRVVEAIRFADALPYNEMGKLLHRDVKLLFNE